MLSKAKTLTGEWVKGYYSRMKNSAWIEGLNNPYCLHKINPSTLCQQVRGTEFFEGDEFEYIHARESKFYLAFDEKKLQWILENEYQKVSYNLSRFKPTGKNKHDDE